jgi:hypothetical protein
MNTCALQFREGVGSLRFRKIVCPPKLCKSKCFQEESEKAIMLRSSTHSGKGTPASNYEREVMGSIWSKSNDFREYRWNHVYREIFQLAFRKRQQQIALWCDIGNKEL